MFNSARRLLAALLLLLGTTVALVVAGPAGPAQAAPANCGYPAAACECPTLAVNATVVAPGEKITVTGTNFSARARVTLVLEPASGSGRSFTLKTVTTNSSGAFSTRITMPTGSLNKGNFIIKATSGFVATAACPADPSASLRVAAANDTVLGEQNNPSSNNGAPTTAFTGFNILWFTLLAAALVIVGFAFNRRGKKIEVRSIRS